MIKFTDEEREFFKNFAFGHSYKEIQQAFIQKFKHDISLDQVRSFIRNHHLNTGRTGRFQKGSIPHNKGQKGVTYAGSEKGWFQKGRISQNHRPVGSERVSKDGYIEIKVEEPNKWKLKHRIVYENEHGKIPDGNIVTFRDGNRTNVNLSNLLLINKSVNAVLNKTGLNTFHGELKETAISLAELKMATTKAKKSKTSGGQT